MKRGISLIAVLMFMLAATTASVVVFRMIGSESFSSGARLKATEAYQASESGIDAVQAWLSNKAMDASGLITQYDKDKKPIELKVGGLSGNSRNQDFKAFLVGVDFKDNSALKLKFLVEGRGRDDSKVSQAVIFNTAGLYKVNVNAPELPPPPSSWPTGLIDEYALWATGNVNTDGQADSLPVTSAVINGDWKGNPAHVLKDFIVTGDATLSGNDIRIDGTICIGRNAAFQNNEKKSGDLYVGGDLGLTDLDNKGACGIFDDVYVEGNVRASSSRPLTVVSNLEVVKGTIFPYKSTPFTVKKNLVLGNEAKLEFRLDQTEAKFTYPKYPEYGELRNFNVQGNVWIPNANGIKCSSVPPTTPPNDRTGCLPEGIKGLENAKDWRKLGGNQPTFSIAVKNLINHGGAAEKAFKQKDANPQAVFSSEAKQVDVNNTALRPTGAVKSKNHCDSIWTRKGPGNNTCGKDFLVDDIITTSITDTINGFRTKIRNSDCPEINNAPEWQKQEPYNSTVENPIYNENSVSAINACYDKFKDSTTKLFNGFLVLKLKVVNNSTANSKLKGKFIFIFDEKVGIQPYDPSLAEFILPEMNDSTSMAFLYFAEGSGIIEQKNGCSKNSNYNYFIYSLGDITKIQKFTNDCPIKGTIYFPTKDPKTGECKTYGETNVNAAIKSNTDLLRALEGAGVICHPSQPCAKPGGVSGGGGGSSSSVVSGGSSSSATIDPQYIPIASRLSVNIDSKEITKESVPTKADTITPSILVMPRVIRLTPTTPPKQKNDLKDYYNLLPLNSTTQIPKQDPTECKDIKSGENITKFEKPNGGPYLCTFGRQDITDFYVVVGN